MYNTIHVSQIKVPDTRTWPSAILNSHHAEMACIHLAVVKDLAFFLHPPFSEKTSVPFPQLQPPIPPFPPLNKP